MAKPVSIPSGELELEGMLHLPQGQGSFPGVVVLHPHPLYGGDMDNNVVVALAKALAEASFIALRFNFRGVGGSQGSYAQGIGEREDARAALSYLAAQSSKLGLVGYSFGAEVALATAGGSPIEALALISPPLSPPGLGALRNFSKPSFIVSGSMDTFIPPLELERQAQGLTPLTEVKAIPGADHFWLGYEAILCRLVSEFFRRHL